MSSQHLPGVFNDKSDAHVTYAYGAVPFVDDVEPATYKQTVESPLSDNWKEAMDSEISLLAGLTKV